MRKILFLILGIFLISFASASISYNHANANPTSSYLYIYVDGETGMDFKTILEYFEDNPITDRNISYPRFYGVGNTTSPYELNEGDISEWSSTSGIISNETDNVYYGDSATNISGTTGAFTVKWNEADQLFANTGYHYFNFGVASEIRFMVYANQSVNISKITTVQTTAGTYTQEYVKYRDDIWQIPADTWTEVVVDLGKDMVTYSGRYYAHQWSQLHIDFDSSADIIIDGSRWFLEDPTPRIKRINYYTNPIGMYIHETDFDDAGFIYESTMIDGRSSYGRLRFEGGDVTLGSKLYGGVLIGNSRTLTDNSGVGYMFQAEANSVYDLDGLRFAGNKGFKGVSLYPYATSSSSTLTMDDMSIYSLADIYYSVVSGAEVNATNILVGYSRYPIWGAGQEFVNFARYIYYNWYIWMDKGTISNLIPKTNNVRFSFHRSYQRPSNDIQTANFINLDKSSLTSSSYARLQLYEKAGNTNVTQELNILNSLKLNFIDSIGGAVPNVGVSITGSNDILLSSGLSDSDGIYEDNILETKVQIHENFSDGIGNHAVDYRPLGVTTATSNTNYSVDDYNPLTISISKDGYQSLDYIYNLTGEQNWVAKLASTSSIDTSHLYVGSNLKLLYS